MAYRFVEEIITPTIDHVSAAIINAGGTGHAVDDIITMNLGTGGVGTACTIRVTAESSGVITTISVETSGSYTTIPSPTTAITQASTTGSGVGFTADLTFLTEQGYNITSQAMLDIITSGRVTGVTIDSGGTGYAVDDVITLNATGAVALYDAKFQVTSVAAGVVDGLRMISSGAFTTLPDVTDTSHATTGGTGTSLTVDVTVEGTHTAVFAAAGTGYVVGEIVTVTGGTLHSGASALQFVVTAETAGVVDTVEPLRVGRYDVYPTNPVSTTADASGTGLTLTLTQSSWIHAEDSASEDFVDGITEFSWWARGVNSAGSDPYIGGKTISDGSLRWLGLKCATGFDNAQTFENQPNASPGDFTDPSVDGGPRIPSTDSAVTLFIAIAPRVINFVWRTAPTYEHGVMGLFIPFIDSPETKYPLPMICAGTTQSDAVGISTTFVGRATNTELTMHASILHGGESATTGPHLMRDLVGNWRQFEVEAAGDDAVMRIWPLCSQVLTPSDVDAPDIESGSGTVTPGSSGNTGLDDGQSGTSSNGPYNSNTALNPTPFGPGGDDLFFLVPPIIYEEFGSTHQLIGEIEGLFAINGRGLSAEDRTLDDDGNIFFCFTDTNTSENRNFCAIREGD